MKKPILLKRLVALLGITAFIALCGCRTANGFGQDMEKAGESIQEGTR
jgi:predicted small secreted protein